MKLSCEIDEFPRVDDQKPWRKKVPAMFSFKNRYTIVCTVGSHSRLRKPLIIITKWHEASASESNAIFAAWSCRQWTQDQWFHGTHVLKHTHILKITYWFHTSPVFQLSSSKDFLAKTRCNLANPIPALYILVASDCGLRSPHKIFGNTRLFALLPSFQKKEPHSDLK